MKERESFSTRLGFILVSAGCAIGIGNVWKFPYLVGENGGGFYLSSAVNTLNEELIISFFFEKNMGICCE